MSNEIKTLPLKTKAQALAPVAPIKPHKSKTKKAPKPKRQIICTCPSCQFVSETGTFYCLKLSEWGIYSDGQLLGYRSTYNEADSLMRQHLYTTLTKHAA